MSETWVVNASPVIVLAKISHLALLEAPLRRLLVPDAVIAEILAGPPSDPARRAVEGGWGQRVTTPSVPAEVAVFGLDSGEMEVLAVALQYAPSTAVLDDRAARKGAAVLGLSVIGTVGIVVRAKREQRIPSAAAVIADLRAVGLRLDEALIRDVLAPVGESWP